jgi:isoleucyl-tRNA synthetase
MRWFLLSGPVLRGQDLVADEQGIVAALRQVVIPLWHAYKFFCDYANVDGHRATARSDAHGVLDRYILAKTNSLVVDVVERMDAYDLDGACQAVTAFIDALNNWYIRRSRERVWAAGMSDDKIDCYDTLFMVLTTVCRVTAPLLPMLTETTYRGLTGERSVHLTDFPEPGTLPEDDALVTAMDSVRDVCSAVLSIRRGANLRVRLPLTSITIAVAEPGLLEPFRDLIADEVNVKEVRLSADVDAIARRVLEVNAAVVGPRLGPDAQAVFRAARQGDWTLTDDGVQIAGQRLRGDDFTLAVRPLDVAGTRVLNSATGAVSVDLTVTPELESEGLARDVVRLVQSARRQAELRLDDRIHLFIDLPGPVAVAVERHRDHVCAETLAVDLALGPMPPGVIVHEATLDAGVARVGVARATAPPGPLEPMR